MLSGVRERGGTESSKGLRIQRRREFLTKPNLGIGAKGFYASLLLFIFPSLSARPSGQAPPEYVSAYTRTWLAAHEDPVDKTTLGFFIIIHCKGFFSRGTIAGISVRRRDKKKKSNTCL